MKRVVIENNFLKYLTDSDYIKVTEENVILLYEDIQRDNCKLLIPLNIQLSGLMRFVEEFSGSDLVVVVLKDHVIYPGFLSLFNKVDFQASYEKVDVRYTSIKDSLLMEVKKLV
jgi:hypothetical protein